MSGVKHAWRRSTALFAVAFLAGINLTGAGLASARAETILRARLNADLLSFDPGTRRDENTDGVMMHIVEGLVAYREDGSVGPLLASAWHVSADGLSYRFDLRRGVVFHNGVGLTSADVIWSLKRYVAEGPKWRCGSELKPDGSAPISDIVAPDPYTVVIRLSRPSPLFLATLARPDCGETGIISPKSVDAQGRFITPVGTGPFKLATWKRNQYVDLVRFEHYASLPGPRDGNTGGKAALVDRVRFLIIPDSAAAGGALLRGGLDVLDSVDPNSLDTYRDKTGRFRAGLRIDIAPTMDFYGILLQTRDPLLSDPRLRRAIALSIDVTALAGAVSGGMSVPDNSFIPRVSPYFGDPKNRLRAQNLALARQLVKQSGYRGQALHMVTNHRYPQMFDSAVLVQAMAREAGINIVIDTLDWASELDRYASGHYQMMSFAYSSRLDPAFNLAPLVGSKDKDPRKVWDSPYALAQLKAASTSADPHVRQAAFDALNSAFLSDVPMIVLFNSSRIGAVRSNVTGFAGWRTGQPRYWGVGLKQP